MKTASLILAALSCGVCNAGPLGLEMGTPLKDLQSVATLTPNGSFQYSAKSLPDGHPDFNDYRLLITPQHGLCKVSAWTPPISTSVYGNELLSTFERFFQVLTNKYGTANRHDYLRRGSIWNEPKDWMMALRRKERVLVAYWLAKDLQLPDNISAIKIEAYALGTDSGSISIGYEFTNADQCIDWIRSRKDSKL